MSNIKKKRSRGTLYESTQSQQHTPAKNLNAQNTPSDQAAYHAKTDKGVALKLDKLETRTTRDVSDVPQVSV